MPGYYVSTQAQDNGDHEVHKDGCQHMPRQEHRLYLGHFVSCHEAMLHARKHFPTANGCAQCAPACHTG